MAVTKKGSRKIIVEGHEFRWRATGNDGWIGLVIWPDETQACKIVGTMGYDSETIDSDGGVTLHHSQAIITNRIVRAIILKLGVRKLLAHQGHLDIGDLSSYFDMSQAVRAKKSSG